MKYAKIDHVVEHRFELSPIEIEAAAMEFVKSRSPTVASISTKNWKIIWRGDHGAVAICKENKV